MKLIFENNSRIIGDLDIENLGISMRKMGNIEKNKRLGNCLGIISSSLTVGDIQFDQY